MDYLPLLAQRGISCVRDSQRYCFPPLCVRLTIKQHEGRSVATLPTLVSAMAEVDGRDRKSVEHIGRVIREAGYITSGKRGGGAPDMTPREATNLIIALNGADLPKEAPVAIDRFRSLKQYYSGTAQSIQGYVDKYDHLPKPMQDAMDVHTFGEAIEALIEGVPDMVASFLQYYMQGYERDRDDALKHLLPMLRLGSFGVDVTFRRYSGLIEMFTMQGSDRRVEFEARFTHDPDRIDSDFYGRQWPDRKVQSTIGFYTLLTAWRTLNDEKAPLGIELDDK